MAQVLTHEDKIKIALGATAAVLIAWGIGALNKKKKKKKPVDYGLKVGPLCNEYTVTDPTKLRLAEETAWVEWLSKGVKDPWVLTSAVVRKVAPTCRVPGPRRKPHEMRSPGEALFYYDAFTDTVCYMIDRNVINSEQAIAHARVAQAWAIQQGVAPNDPRLKDPVCATGPTEKPPDWLVCEPPTVPIKVGNTWECRCPDGSIPTLVPDPRTGETVTICR